MRRWIRLAAAGAAAFLTIAASDAELRAGFDRDLGAWRLDEAARKLDALIEARAPADGKPRPDPEINALVGRFLLRRGVPDNALPFLREARMHDAADQARLDLARGQAELFVGEYDRAAATLAQVAAGAPDPGLRAAAARARIEALLATDPGAAGAAIAAAAALREASPAHEWEWALYQAQAALLTGDAAGAQRAAQAAWAAAPRARPFSHAVPRISAMLGMLAERRGDRDGAVAAFADAAGPAPSDGTPVRRIVHRLPVCGDEVLRDDMIVVSVHRDDESLATRLAPLWASRPAIVRHFLDGFNAQPMAPQGDMGGDVTVMALRCRTAPSSEAPAPRAILSPESEWTARKGLYPLFDPELVHGDDALAEAGRRLDALEARYGKDSPLLLGALGSVLRATGRRLRSDGDVSPTRMVELNQRVAALLKATGGAEAFLAEGFDPATMMPPTSQRLSAEEARQRLVAGFRSFIGGLPFAQAYDALKELDDIGFLMPAERKALLVALAARGRAAVGERDPRMVSLALDQIHLARAMDDAAAQHALARGAGLAPDLCAVREREPRFSGSAISDRDFPVEGMLAGLAGLSVLEFDLDSAGRHGAARVLASAPAFLFDATIARAAGSITYEPARAGGRAVPCRGIVTNIRWDLPRGGESDEFAPLTWTPGT